MNEWTNKRPDTPGIYWLRLPSGNYKGAFVIALKKHISALGDTQMECTQALSGGRLDHGWCFNPYDPDDNDHLEKDALWAGPLTPPKLNE